MLSNIFSFSFLALPLVAFANPHASVHHARHAEIAKRQSSDIQLHKRYEDARWSFYDVGLSVAKFPPLRWSLTSLVVVLAESITARMILCVVLLLHP